jgi:hypothetical protein
VAAKVMLDFTMYLSGVSVSDLDALWDFYAGVCPPGRLVLFKIDELLVWSNLARPDLTQSARDALARGRRRPYFEATRRRVEAQRSFTSRLWDGRGVDDADGSWSFLCAGIRRRATGLHSIARLVVPLSTDPGLLERIALEMAGRFDFHSGHGGLVFVYDPFLEGSAFDAIYGLSKRFWGVDIESIDLTLPLMATHIKGVNWITALGNQLASQVAGPLEELRRQADVKVHGAGRGLVIVAGDAPSAGDQNRAPGSPAPYKKVADTLAPLFLPKHPDFPGDRFVKGGDTSAWVRRFIEPAAW